MEWKAEGRGQGRGTGLVWEVEDEILAVLSPAAHCLQAFVLRSQDGCILGSSVWDSACENIFGICCTIHAQCFCWQNKVMVSTRGVAVLQQLLELLTSIIIPLCRTGQPCIKRRVYHLS